MEILVLDDAEAVARKAAGFVADTLREAIAVRGLATLALSGGHTPARMLEPLAGESIPWSKLHLFQTDDRMVPGDDAARNAGAIRRLLTDHVPLPPQQLHWMPVERADVEAACQLLWLVCGADKRRALRALLERDGSTPAG